MKKKTSVIILGVVAGLAAMSGIAIGATVQAEGDSVVDQVNITVPISCTMTGTGMNTHNADINNGQLNSSIGETTMKAFCNDSGGFAIYAIGYTDNTAGKNVLTSSTLGSDYDIATGTATGPVGNVDTSAWAMRLNTITSPAPSYPITIAGSSADAEREQGDPDYSTFQAVPDDYTLVAKRTSGTDIGQSAEGSTLKTTYQAYISKTQPAGTYTGQVKYTLVHPSTAPQPVNDNQIGVIYDGNGLYFDQAGTRATNRVVYEEQCEDEYGYIGNTPAILKTRNLNDDGTWNESYAQEGGDYYEGDGVDPSSAYFDGATKLKIVIRYGLTQGVGYFDPYASSGIDCGELCDGAIDRSGTVTYIVDGDYFGIYSELGGNSTNAGYDYGVYAEVYPVYDESTEGATYGLIRGNVCTYQPVVGAFANVIGGNDIWYSKDVGEDVETFYNYNDYDDTGIVEYLSTHTETLSGTTITIHASNKYTIVFDANGGSGTMENQEIYQYGGTYLNTSTFTAPPHKEIINWNTMPDGSGEAYEKQQYIRSPILDANSGGSVTLYAQWGKCLPRTICYDDNGANSPTKMENHYPGSYSSRYYLWASNFQRQNYGFAGWNTEADGSGTNYGPNQYLGFIYNDDDFIREGIRLYAKWVPSAGNIQNWTGCPNLSIGDVTALTDTRDSNTYAVAKLADGNCWMIENMRLGSSSSMTLTTADTQSAGTLPAATTTNGDRSLIIQNTVSPVSSMQNTDSNVYSYGNYYGWYTAINRTSTLGGGTQSTSICPAGWHLPYGGSDTGAGGGNTSGGFYYLGSIIGNYNFKNYPNNFILSGGHYGGGLQDRGLHGTYWSATYNSGGILNTRVYELSVGSVSAANYNDAGSTSSSISIRCVMNSSN